MKKSGTPIQLNTITGYISAKRDICTLKVSGTINIEAILVKKMDISTYTMERPSCWSKYDKQWASTMPLGTKAIAQILLGADLAPLFPYDVINEDNLPVQTTHARLRKSWITGKYLTVGHNVATT